METARGQGLQALREGQRVGSDGTGRQDTARDGRNVEGRAHADEILAEELLWHTPSSTGDSLEARRRLWLRETVRSPAGRESRSVADRPRGPHLRLLEEGRAGTAPDPGIGRGGGRPALRAGREPARAAAVRPRPGRAREGALALRAGAELGRIRTLTQLAGSRRFEQRGLRGGARPREGGPRDGSPASRRDARRGGARVWGEGVGLRRHRPIRGGPRRVRQSPRYPEADARRKGRAGSRGPERHRMGPAGAGERRRGARRLRWRRSRSSSPPWVPATRRWP